MNTLIIFLAILFTITLMVVMGLCFYVGHQKMKIYRAIIEVNSSLWDAS